MLMQNLWGQTKSIVFSEEAYYNDMKWYMKCFICWYPYNDIPYNGDDVDDDDDNDNDGEVGHDNDESQWKMMNWDQTISVKFCSWFGLFHLGLHACKNLIELLAFLASY